MPTELYDFHWTEAAACGGMDVELFFDEDHRESVQEAKRVCRSCPVRTECLRDHMREPWGIFGGLKSSERRNLRRKVGRVA